MTTNGSIYLVAALQNFYFLNFQETSGTTVASEGRSRWRKAGNNLTKFYFLDFKIYYFKVKVLQLRNKSNTLMF